MGGMNDARRTYSFRLMDVAYIRDGELMHVNEAVILACLLHTKGKGRQTPDMQDVRKIMRDKNLDN